MFRFSTFLGRSSSALKIGIIGMANIGKSSTFNLFTGLNVPAENVPFCTIEPNQAVVQVQDPRFSRLCQAYRPKKQSPPLMRVVDIAGLVKGASQGYGLGNQFLSNISQVDGLFQVVRCFKDVRVTHTEGGCDPLRDIQIIKHQLCAKDLSQAEKRVPDLQNKYKRSQTQDLKLQIQTMSKVIQLLKADSLLAKHLWKDFEIKILNKYNFLTSKPTLYLLNNQGGPQTQVSEILKKRGQKSIVYSVALQEEYKLEQGQTSSKINQLISAGYELLGLIHFYTVGPDQVKCWTIRKGLTIQQAAGEIHTDLSKGFISAWVLGFQEWRQGKQVQREGRKEGKTYVVREGDLIVINSKIKK